MSFIWSVIAGAAMSLQGVINTRLSDKTGLFESNVFIQGTAFIAALLVMFFFGKGDITKITSVNPLYLTGGLLGIVITVTVMLGISGLSPTVAISVILISQLTVAALIDAFGILGAEKVSFGLSKYIGLALMIAGTLIFKLKS